MRHGVFTIPSYSGFELQAILNRDCVEVRTRHVEREVLPIPWSAKGLW